MNSKIVISTTVIVVIAVGVALILTHDSNAFNTLMDAIAIMIALTVLSFRVWLRDKTFRPARRRLTKARPIYRAHTRSPRTRQTQVMIRNWTKGPAVDQGRFV